MYLSPEIKTIRHSWPDILEVPVSCLLMKPEWETCVAQTYSSLPGQYRRTRSNLSAVNQESWMVDGWMDIKRYLLNNITMKILKLQLNNWHFIQCFKCVRGDERKLHLNSYFVKITLVYKGKGEISIKSVSHDTKYPLRRSLFSKKDLLTTLSWTNSEKSFLPCMKFFHEAIFTTG